jgi:signal transduction histidine kinase
MESGSYPRWLGSRVGVVAVLSAALVTELAVAAGALPRVVGFAAAAILSCAVLVWRLAPRPRTQTGRIVRRDRASLSSRPVIDWSSCSSPGDVARALERILDADLRCQRVEVALGCDLSRSSSAELESGTHPVAKSRDGSGRSMTFDVIFRGEKLAKVTATRAAKAAPFTGHEIEAAKSTMQQGAVALAYALAVGELEERRQQSAAAWRDERETLVETLAAEIAHEVRYPINFFRSIFQHAARTRLLDHDDIDIGCEEVDRLERLVSELRRMASQHLERRMVGLSELCTRAQALLRNRMPDGRFHVELENDGALYCDPDKMTQVLVNLLANAIEATAGRGDVGIRWVCDDRGGTLDVWDTGPGFVGEPARLFTAGHTTKPRGTGLGLAITSRLIRAHGWSIEAFRRDARTVFRVCVPGAEIARSSGTHRIAPRAASDEVGRAPEKDGKVA